MADRTNHQTFFVNNQSRWRAERMRVPLLLPTVAVRVLAGIEER
jgi:hypothetical protein